MEKTLQFLVATSFLPKPAGIYKWLANLITSILKANIMALNQNKTKTSFEDGMEGEGTADTKQMTTKERLAAAAAENAAATKDAEKTETSAPTQSKSTALAPAANRQVKAAEPMINPLELLKNVYPLEFDTLRGLKVSNGNIVDIRTGKALGEKVGLELVTYQDQWVISPGVDGDEGKEHVRYSDDGVTTSKGENCSEYLQQLKDNGYTDAKMAKRTVIGGSLFYIGTKGERDLKDMQDGLVQMSLAPTSKSSFDRYCLDQAFKLRKGLIEPEGAERVAIECEPASKNGKDWTIANFSRWVD